MNASKSKIVEKPRLQTIHNFVSNDVHFKKTRPATKLTALNKYLEIIIKQLGRRKTGKLTLRRKHNQCHENF